MGRIIDIMGDIWYNYNVAIFPRGSKSLIAYNFIKITGVKSKWKASKR